MLNFLLTSCSTSSSGNGCYDWPVIKQIVWLFSKALGYLYQFLDSIGIANLGLAIILFTIIVKAILIPLTVHQQKYTKRTSYMQPEIAAIQKKYEGRRDQYAAQAQQAEMKAVYAKYGVSQTAGCLPTLVQMPILIAFYGALRAIPTAIDAISNSLEPVATLIMNASESIQTSVSEISSALIDTDLDSVITSLYSLSLSNWENLEAIFTGTDAQLIADSHSAMQSLNTFLGLDLSQTPWNLIKGGGFGILAVLIPIIAAVSQWFTFKLGQTKESASANSSMAATNRSMGIMMPLVSAFFCLSLSSGLGVYWCLSSIIQGIQQIVINRHFRKIDMEALIEKNLEKAEAKAKKKREKNGVSGDVISSAASINTKKIDPYDPANYDNAPKTISEIAKMDVNEVKKTNKPSANSLAAKAASVAQYNEEHPEDSAKVRKKYKK